MGYRGSAGQGQARYHREDGGEGHGREEAEEQVATHGLGQVHGNHVAAADQGTAGVATDEELRVFADDDDGSKAQHHHHQEEEADKAGGVEHRLTRFFGIRHGEEAHQDVRQPGDAEDQAEGHRGGVDRVGEHAARAHDLVADGVGIHRLGCQCFQAEAELAQRQQRQGGATGQQQHGLDDLYPGGGDHAAEDHVDQHQGADRHHRGGVVEAEQQLDQLAGADHLHHQVAATPRSASRRRRRCGSASGRGGRRRCRRR